MAVSLSLLSRLSHISCAGTPLIPSRHGLLLQVFAVVFRLQRPSFLPSPQGPTPWSLLWREGSPPHSPRKPHILLSPLCPGPVLAGPVAPTRGEASEWLRLPAPPPHVQPWPCHPTQGCLGHVSDWRLGVGCLSPFLSTNVEEMLCQGRCTGLQGGRCGARWLFRPCCLPSPTRLSRGSSHGFPALTRGPVDFGWKISFTH